MKLYRIEIIDTVLDKRVVGEVTDKQLREMENKFGIEGIHYLLGELNDQFTKLYDKDNEEKELEEEIVRQFENPRE